jgi:hypothetical protein
MKFSLKAVTDFAKSKQGKDLLRRAKALDTPANRKKAADLLEKVRPRGK